MEGQEEHPEAQGEATGRGVRRVALCKGAHEQNYGGRKG